MANVPSRCGSSLAAGAKPSRARTGNDQRRVGRSLPTFDLQHLDTSDEVVLIAGTGLRPATGLRRVASGQLSLLGPSVQCREDGRKIRHHRVVAAFVNCHVADAAVEAIAQRRGEARCTVSPPRSRRSDPHTVGAAKSLLHLREVCLVVQRVGRCGRAQRVRADLMMPEERSPAAWLEEMLGRHTGVHCLQRTAQAGYTHVQASPVSALARAPMNVACRVSARTAHAIKVPLVSTQSVLEALTSLVWRAMRTGFFHTVDSVSSARRQTLAAQFVRGA